MLQVPLKVSDRIVPFAVPEKLHLTVSRLYALYENARPGKTQEFLKILF
jgi:hypothetical protein